MMNTLVATCTAMFIQYVGHPPVKSELVLVPRSVERSHTFAERTKAKSCAVLLGVRWRIIKDQ